MDTKTRNDIIAKLLGEGKSLSEVQKILEDEHGERITYMELRLVSTDLDVDWGKIDQTHKQEHQVDDVTKVPSEEDAVKPPSGTQVTVSKVVRPGAMFSGEVTFKSGARAEWYVDQFGRLGLNPAEGSAQPDQDDIQDFQEELQKVLQSKMGGAI